MRIVFLRRRSFCKLLFVVLSLLVCLYFLHRFTSWGSDFKKKGAELLSIDTFGRFPGGKFGGRIKPQDLVVAIPPGERKDENEENAPQINVPDKSKPPYAVFKKGILGNYEPKEPPMSYKPGEGGKPVHTSMAEKSKADATIREFGFNMVASDKIAMDRSVPDTRMDECKYWHYPEKLPTASVILVFYNEGWSTLVRTVHSVVNTSPSQLLHEVVLIDDGSDVDSLKAPLEDYIKQWNGKVKLFRNKERIGLIQARNRGAEVSTGDVIVFLDAHCECNRNWLVPLLARINYDRKILVVPIVDGISWDTLAYNSVYDSRHHRGIFEWGFLYKESAVPEKELATREHPSEPYKSPTHAGGLFAMDRKYFWEMGGYDPGLMVWGGENYELAFKVWMCGGSSEWVPCSRVGHIYRGPRVGGKEIKNANPKLPFTLVNYMRVVEVWMDDEHKEYYYTRDPIGRGAPIGDISKQLQFKKDHNCKDFKWFMENVAYDVYEKFPRLPPNKAWGEVKEAHGEERCWDTLGQSAGGGPIGIYPCHRLGGSQLFRINVKGQIGIGERCLESPNGDTLHIGYCEIEPTGPWDYDLENGHIRHTSFSKCVEAGSDQKLHLVACDPNSSQQKWEVNNVHPWKT